MNSTATNHDEVISVSIARWAVGAAPVKIRTLLGSCVGIVFYDRVGRVGGVAHILLPASQANATEHPGKYADTAIPALLADLERLAGARIRGRITAKIFGGAAMFPTRDQEPIGDRNRRAVDQILGELGIAIVARDVGGDTGRRVTLDTTNGKVEVKIPGGAEYDI